MSFISTDDLFISITACQNLLKLDYYVDTNYTVIILVTLRVSGKRSLQCVLGKHFKVIIQFQKGSH